MLTYQDFFKDIELGFIYNYDLFIKESMEHHIFLADTFGHDDETRQNNIKETQRLKDIQNKLFGDKRENYVSEIQAITESIKSIQETMDICIETDHHLYSFIGDHTNVWLAKNDELISGVLEYDIVCIEKGVTSLLNDGEDPPFPYFVTREEVSNGTKISHHLHDSLKEVDDANYKKFTELSNEFHDLKVEMAINSLTRVFVLNYPDVAVEDIEFYLSHFDCLWV